MQKLPKYNQVLTIILMQLKKLLLLLFIVLAYNSFSQKQPSLKEILWKSVKPCYSNLTMDFELKKEDIMDAEIIDDSKNGYLKVSGSFPTCGCSCLNISGAYKQKDKTYTILTKEEWACSTHKKLKSNRPLNSVLPENFGINTFIPNYKSINYNENYAVFYLELDIPRVGTDTKTSLSIIPIGANSDSNTILTYNYSENKNTKYGYVIHTIAKNIENKNTLNFILNKNYDKVSTKDMLFIKNSIDKYTNIQSIDDLSNQLNHLYKIYNLYKLIEYETIILGWDKNNARFYIKEKITSPKALIGFKEFLITKLVGCMATC